MTNFNGMTTPELQKLHQQVTEALKKRNVSEAFKPGNTFHVDNGGNLRLVEAGDPVRMEAAAQLGDRQFEADVKVYESLGLTRKGAEAAVRGRDARF